jgi:hypothetical protein
MRSEDEVSVVGYWRRDEVAQGRKMTHPCKYTCYGWVDGLKTGDESGR